MQLLIKEKPNLKLSTKILDDMVSDDKDQSSSMIF